MKLINFIPPVQRPTINLRFVWVSSLYSDQTMLSLNLRLLDVNLDVYRSVSQSNYSIFSKKKLYFVKTICNDCNRLENGLKFQEVGLFDLLLNSNFEGLYFKM